MTYYFNKTIRCGFEETIAKVTEALKKEGFGVLTKIDIKDKLKEKINVDFKKYMILGACNPPCAHEALKVEDKIGLMLPCNVIVQEIDDGKVEVAAINPVASMQAVENQKLLSIAGTVRDKLEKVVESLQA